MCVHTWVGPTPHVCAHMWTHVGTCVVSVVLLHPCVHTVQASNTYNKGPALVVVLGPHEAHRKTLPGLPQAGEEIHIMSIMYETIQDDSTW